MPAGYSAVRRVNELAFGRPQETDLVDRLRVSCPGLVGIRCEYDGVPDEAFMILVLEGEALAGFSGVARYRPEFADV